MGVHDKGSIISRHTHEQEFKKKAGVLVFITRSKFIISQDILLVKKMFKSLFIKINQ